jgi:O-antigen ligase
MKRFDKHYLMGIETVVSVLLLSYPAIMLTVKRGMNAVLLAFLLLAFLVWLRPPVMVVSTDWKREWTPYLAAMFAMTASIFISQAYHQNFSAIHYDSPARYWLAIPVFLLLYRLELRVFLALQLAFPIAAIVGWVLARDIGNGVTLPLMDKIRYGDSMLLFSMLSLLSIDWLGRDSLYLRALKWIGFLVGLLATFQSGTRGALLAIPVFVAIYLLSRGIRITLKSALASLALGVMVIGGAYLAINTVQLRLQTMAAEVTAYDQGNRDTSTGIRWQLYLAAVELISERPIFGLGPGGYALQMAPMATAGKITPVAAEYGRGEVHNDILKKMADMGIFGLTAIFAVYLVPLSLFRRASKSDFMRIKRTGLMGMVFVSGFMVFGLTAEVLNLSMTISFYSFTVAVLLAYCYNIHHAEQGAS